MNIIGHKYIFLSFSGILVLVSIAAFSLWGLKQGIEFTGGSLMEIEFTTERPSQDAVKQVFAELKIGNVSVQNTGKKGILLRFGHIAEETHQKILFQLSRRAGSNEINKGIITLGGNANIIEKRFDAIGPTIGRELRFHSFVALALAVAAIILYIAWAFRQVSKPIASWKYGVSAVIALMHDILIPTGIFAALGNFRGVEVDPLFITALLTIMGFSVHDTIVVFDRIRENLRKLNRSEPFEDTVNRSVNETITRSINTSFTVLLVLAAIYLWGGETTHYFSLALILGIVFGTYSSIFVASPLLVIWNSLSTRKK